MSFQCVYCSRHLSRNWMVTAVAFCLWSCNTFAQSPANPVETFKRSTEAIVTDVRKLADQQPAILSDSLVMNTVRQYAKRADLNDSLAERSAESKVWEKKVADGEAQRMRIRNPYDTATYDKYYDMKGDWQFSVIENDYKAAEKIRSDWSSAYSRARASVDDLRREYDVLATGGTLSPSALTELTGMMSAAAARLNQFGAPPPELLPRPVAGADNSPFPTYKAFDSYTGKVVEMGRRHSGGRPTDTKAAAEKDGIPPKSGPAAGKAGLSDQAVDLAGTWNTKRFASTTSGVKKTYMGTLQLRKTSKGYEGEWVQTFTGKYGNRGRVVQAVSVTVVGNKVTVQGSNPQAENAEGGYYADTMYLVIESPAVLVGRDVDAVNNEGTSRVWRK